MTKTRHRKRARIVYPDGSVVVRTFPVTLHHDVTEERLDTRWHQLTFATRGHLEVRTEEARRFVPADRAVWVPAGVAHTTIMRAPISMRSIFVAAPLIGTITAPRTPLVSSLLRVRTIEVSPLLRELILHITRIGALDQSVPAQAHLAAVLLDLLVAANDVATELPSPRDPRAQKLADSLIAQPGGSLERLANKSGASLRTLERCFLAETGLPLGAWRRQVRLFHAQRMLATGESVTDVARETGYANPSAFGHAYLAQFGVRPSQARKR